MKGRAPPSADLLVCFPSRVHLTLMPPKHICSPARPSEHNKRHQRLLKKSSTRIGGGAGGGQTSPLLWVKSRHMGSEITEPTSPKVTCSGQIKVRSKTRSRKNWQSVMEEIERIQNNGKHKKRLSWMESLGFKKEVMQFLTCLRSIRFDFRCFGSFPQSDITTDDEDEEEEYQENDNHVEGDETSRTIFSKWFLVLQENQSNEFYKKEDKEYESPPDHVDDQDQPAVPPANALLLMRCQSAPAKTWLEANRMEENDGEEEEDNLQECNRKDEGKRKNLRCLMDEENIKMHNSLVVLKHGPDFHKLSSDISQETWLLGGRRDPHLLSRSLSWKR